MPTRATCMLTCLAVMLPVTSFAQTKVTVWLNADDGPGHPPFVGTRPAVDVAILLDTSNSMDGLIHQAKSQLWQTVQGFARAKKAGRTPHLRVALFEYGNTRLPATEGYLRQVVPLTSDLDEMSAALFSLTTNGGDEYCGQTVREAIQRLDWSSEPNAFKAIFIAGNEPFDQGSVDYRDACREAIEAGVVVNTIHCGDYQAGIRGHWKQGADLAEGDYFNIDQDRTPTQISCPQDELILRLNTQLNETYLWYGKAEIRGRRRANQVQQDRNAAEVSDVTLVERASAKASQIYDNRERDLVDTFATAPQQLALVPIHELPEAMQAMNEAERRVHLESMAAKRKKIQDEISELSRQRMEYFACQREKQAEMPGEAMLGEAMGAAIRAQLGEAGFEQE